MSVMNGVHNIVRQTYILKRMLRSQHYLRVSPTSVGLNRNVAQQQRRWEGGITHGRGFESGVIKATEIQVGKYHPRTWV